MKSGKVGSTSPPASSDGEVLAAFFIVDGVGNLERFQGPVEQEPQHPDMQNAIKEQQPCQVSGFSGQLICRLNHVIPLG